ncbi:MAG TPA: hypothetical protein VFX20_01340 [Steroidobacteraceae bacterium]|nr:hypothetical protein [Steroidobacteraceae bacterium]
MSTVVSARSARADEHRYFLGAALVVTSVVLWAFSFEYRDLVHPSQFTVLVQVHGLVMFTWVGLFLTQMALIVWHRPLWHRRLGVVGLGIAALVVALGVPTAITASRLGGDHLPPGATSAGFLADAFTQLAAFALLAGSGLALRRRPDFHKRLMLLSNLPPLIAAIVRLVAFLQLEIRATTLWYLLLLAFIFTDVLRTRRLHPALVAGAACLVASDAGAGALAGAAMWSGIVRTLIA